MNRRAISSMFAAALVGAAFLVGTAGPVAAEGLRHFPPQPIDENEIFRGVVNGSIGDGGPAVIQMACFGPFTGHPVAGQTVEVFRFPQVLPGSADFGFTGPAADSIQVDISTETTGLEKAVTFTDYNVKSEIPASLELPCSGTGRVNFIPSLIATGAKTASVPVEFVGEPLPF